MHWGLQLSLAGQWDSQFLSCLSLKNVLIIWIAFHQKMLVWKLSILGGKKGPQKRLVTTLLHLKKKEGNEFNLLQNTHISQTQNPLFFFLVLPALGTLHVSHTYERFIGVAAESYPF